MSETDLKAFFRQPMPEWSKGFSGWAQSELFHWAYGGGRGGALKRELRRRSRRERKELQLWKQRFVTPKLARWIYETLLPDPHLDEEDPWLDLRSALLSTIALHQVEPPWKNEFFWREIEKYKTVRYGMWVVEAMAGHVGGLQDVPRFIALYDDEDACPEVRGEALWGLAYLYGHDPEWDEATRDVCLRALHDLEIPYARVGACYLAAWTSRFEDEVLKLREDETVALPGWGQTVGDYAKDAYMQYWERP